MLNWDLLVKLESKKKMHRLWKQGQVMWEKYGMLELDLTRGAKKR